MRFLKSLKLLNRDLNKPYLVGREWKIWLKTKNYLINSLSEWCKPHSNYFEVFHIDQPVWSFGTVEFSVNPTEFEEKRPGLIFLSRQIGSDRLIFLNVSEFDEYSNNFKESELGLCSNQPICIIFMLLNCQLCFWSCIKIPLLYLPPCNGCNWPLL